MPEPPRTGDAVLELVRKSDVVDPTALSDYLTQNPTLPPAATDTATLLVRAGLITTFQAKLILQGKYRGFRIGPYRILDQLGAGGMGQVFLAEHTAMRRRVAIKVLPAKLAADKVGVERFYREARAVAALDHPNIVRAYDVGCDKGTHYLVMEYVEGEDLDAKMARAGGRLSPGEGCGYVVQAAAGLKHAHDKGLVHRDIKPANLLVDRSGVLRILDMGLARFFEDENDRLTRNLDPGGVMGTADYVAPEQLIDSSAADHRADIYSLGATLFHLVTGRTPFEGTTTAKLVAHQLREALPAHTLNPAVPEDLSDVIRQMMEKKPEERYQDMGAVVAALLPFVTDEKTGPRSGVNLPPLALAAVSQSTTSLQASLARADDPTPDLPGELAAERAARRKKQLAIAGLVAVVIGGVTAVAVAVAHLPGRDRSARTTPPDEDPPNTTPVLGGPPVQAPSPEGPPKLTLGFKLAVDAKAGTEAVVFTPNGRHILTAGGDKLVRVWDANTGKHVRKLEAHSANVRSLSLLPDGKRALSGSADKTIRLWVYETGELLKTYDHPAAPVTNVAALPDGRRFVTAGSDGGLALWDLEAGVVLKVYEKAPLPVYGLAVTRDGRRAVAATWDPKRNSLKAGDDPSQLKPISVWAFDVDTGKEVCRQDNLPASVSHVTLSPDSRQAVFGTDNGIAFLELDTKRYRVHAGVSSRVTCAAFTRDGRHVVATGHDKTLSLWEAETGRLLATEPALPAAGYYTTAAPDGKRVAVCGNTGGASVWQLPAQAVARPPDPSAPALARILVGHTAALEDVLFTPDGTRVIACGADRAVRVWDVATGTLLTRVDLPHQSARGLALLGGNRLVVTFAQDPATRLYDLATGSELRQFAHDPGKGVVSAAALADGRRFLTTGYDQSVRVWDADSGEQLARYPLKANGHGLAATPDGKKFVVGCVAGKDVTVRLWDLEKGAEVRRVAADATVWRVGVSADGKWAGFANKSKLQLWNLGTGEGRVLDGPKGQVDGVAFTRDGRHLLAASADRGLHVWELAGSSYTFSRATEHAAAVRGLALSPDGRLAVTSSVDSTAMLWKLPDALVPK